MAIEFKSEEQRAADKRAKAPKTKLEKTHKVFFILSIIALVILFLYFLVCFNSALIIVPLLVFWLLVVLVPTACTAGIIWANEGYRNFVNKLNGLINDFGKGLAKAAEILFASLPYVSVGMLVLILVYGLLSFFAYHKDKTKKKYLHHLIAACIIFGLGLIFTIVAFIVLKGKTK
ncbi:MAG: hypothetical protein MJ206_03485 [Bacilli bacterium]|nr:hypothetical protein [Bacilli bacterium]